MDTPRDAAIGYPIICVKGNVAKINWLSDMKNQIIYYTTLQPTLQPIKVLWSNCDEYINRPRKKEETVIHSKAPKIEGY